MNLTQNTKARAREALERLFDYCHPIDYEEYKMTPDYFTVRDYLDGKHEADWELIYHDDHPSYYAHYVTARCSKCKSWFYGNEHHAGDPQNKYGAKLWSAFCMNYGEGNKTQFRFMALHNAEEELRRDNDLPTFCQHCGARMRNIRYVW